MVVVLATLGLRNATLVGLAIPGSFFVGITALNALGITMNIVVLFSLILVAGMLVDGVIVTTEYADQGKERKQHPVWRCCRCAPDIPAGARLVTGQWRKGHCS
jgi:multidrug efflux pump subunit AcrB